MNTLRFFFFLSIILTGFSSGMGFANAIGYLPGMEETSLTHMVAYWQATDVFMRARMPIFGNAMLLTLLITSILVFRQKPVNRIAFLLSCIAVSMVILDMVVIFTRNLPINEVLQTIDPENVPASFEPFKEKALRAYYLRSVFMIGSAVSITLSYFQYEIHKSIEAKQNVAV